MSMLRKLLLAVALGMVATFLSSAVSGTAPGFCPNVHEVKPCVLAAAGWPFPYAVDKPGISVEGKVSLSSAVAGEDAFIVSAWLENVAFWTLIFAILLHAAASGKKSGEAVDSHPDN
jgi:hypothetical protein